MNKDKRFLGAAILSIFVITLVVGLPGEKQMRSAKPALTLFNRFFSSNADYLSQALQRDQETKGVLYRLFCAEPRVGGRLLERILDCAWDNDALFSPLMDVYLLETDAYKADLSKLKWDHDPDTAFTCLSSPQSILQNVDEGGRIQEKSTDNWMQFPPDLKVHLALLLDRASPAANRFNEARRILTKKNKFATIPSLNDIRVKEAYFKKDLCKTMKQAEDIMSIVDLTYAWLTLHYYCDGLDTVIREMDPKNWNRKFDTIDGNGILPDGILYATKTPYGLVLIGGPGDTVYPAGDIFLAIDLGGNDTYDFNRLNIPEKMGGKPSFCSTIIDVEGDDYYHGGDGKVAGGVLGYRSLIDMKGDDKYKTGSVGLGAGFMGVGLLADLQGNDSYIAKSFSMGAGAFGVGILLDDAGDDSFISTGLCHGYAGPGGSRLLWRTGRCAKHGDRYANRPIR